MKIIISSLCFFCVFICACSDKKNNADVEFGQVALSISSASINFIDFPLTVDSITLIRANGDRHQLTTGFSVNLANFGENPQYISMDTKVPVGVYSRIMINLAFDKDSTVTYFDPRNSEKPVTQHLLSATGKKLGVDTSNFIINMPFFSSTVEVQTSRSTHLNIGWNLNSSTDIFKSSEGDWVFEFKPLVNASDFKKTPLVELNGRYVGEKDRVISLQSIFDSSNKGLIEVNLNASAKFLSDGKLLSKQKLNDFSPGGYVQVSGEVTTDKGQAIIDASKVVYYENDKAVVKGLVINKAEKILNVFGGDVSTSDYLTQPNKQYKLPDSVVEGKERSYGLFSTIKIQLAVDQVEALFRGGLYPSSEHSVVLEGEEEEAVALDESAKVVEGEDESDYDVFYFVLQNSTADPTDTATDKTVTIISLNGLTIPDSFGWNLRVMFESTDTKVDWSSGSLWRGKGMSVYEGDENILLLSTIEGLNPESLDTYAYDFKLEQQAVSSSSGVLEQSSLDWTAMDEARDIESLSDRLVFSRPLNLQSSATEGIMCKSISMNLQVDDKAEYKEDSGLILFETINDEDEWGDPYQLESLGFSEAVDGSDVNIVYSRSRVLDAMSVFRSIWQTELLIHSLRIVNESGADSGQIVDDDGHCSLAPQNIYIRLVKGGTIIDDVLKGSTHWTRHATTGAIVYGALGVSAALLLGSLVYEIYKKIASDYGEEGIRKGSASFDSYEKNLADRPGLSDKQRSKLKERAKFYDFESKKMVKTPINKNVDSSNYPDSVRRKSR